MKKQLVLAIWNRNYDWIQQINPDVEIFLYNKNTETLKEGEIFLQNNVGRDVHTFFLHILNNYDNLPDYIITSQDHPHDHVESVVDLVNGDTDYWNMYATGKYGECWFFNPFLGKLKCDAVGAPHHPGLQVGEIWNKFFKTPFPGEIEFVPAGHFCISREQIQKRSKEFYQMVVTELEINSSSPWVIERLENYIFEGIVQ